MFQYLVKLCNIVYYPIFIKPWHFQQNSAQTLVTFTQTSQTDRHTYVLLCTLVAPDTLLQSAKFHLCTPFQSKVILTHVNSTDYPLAGLNCTQKSPALASTSTPPYIHSYKTLFKNID